MTRDEILTNITNSIMRNIFYKERKLEKTFYHYETIITKRELIDIIEDENVRLGDVYHAHGIGNNNEFPIYREIEITTNKGEKIFTTEQIGSFWFTYSVYASRVRFGLNDYNKECIFSTEYLENVFNIWFRSEETFAHTYKLGVLATLDNLNELVKREFKDLY